MIIEIINSAREKHTVIYISLLILILLLTACNLPSQSAALEEGSTQIIDPVNAAQFAVGDLVNVHTSISEPGGVAAASLLVNDQVHRDDIFRTPLRQGDLFQPWQPTEPGTYTLQVRLSTLSSGVVESNIVTVYVGAVEQSPTEMTITPSPVEIETEDIRESETVPVPSETLPSTLTNTVIPTETSTITFTPTLGVPTFTADQASNCRSGPSSSLYPTQSSINKGDTVPITGKSSAEWGLWWVVEVGGVNCWVYSDLGSADGNLESVPVIPAPALPTDTPTQTLEPLTAPNPISPSGTLNCAQASGGVTLSWSAVAHPNGIDRYEWELVGPFSDSGSTGNTQASTISLTCAGANFQWRVRAIDGQGNIGPWSGFMTFNVP